MTKINEYIWHIPHDPLADDPPEISMLQDAFNVPIASLLSEPFAALGYDLKSSDVMVKLDDRLDHTADTYYANVRFIHYLRQDVLVRVHFQHDEWASFLADGDRHRYFINLDRFKVADLRTQVAIPGWEGRLHTRMTSRPEQILEHSGDDQIWAFSTPAQFEEQLNLFWEKFIQLGQKWLENPSHL